MKSWSSVYAELQPIEQDIVQSLAELCEQLKPQRILEIGSGWGMSLRTFIQYAPTARIITIDKLLATDRRGYIERTEGALNNVIEIVGDAKIEVPKLDGYFDFVYIDGSHDYADVLADLQNSLPKIQGGGTIVMDDVLHVKNTQDYGVLQALRTFLMEHKDSFASIQLRTVGHGQAVIHV